MTLPMMMLQQQHGCHDLDLGRTRTPLSFYLYWWAPRRHRYPLCHHRNYHRIAWYEVMAKSLWLWRDVDKARIYGTAGDVVEAVSVSSVVAGSKVVR